MKKKLFALFMVAAMTVTTIVGCGNTNGAEQGPALVQEESTKDNVQDETGKKAVIDIFQNKSEISEQLQAAVDLYMKEHPNVTIHLESVQGNDYNTALKAKMLNEDAPEIFALAFNEIAGDYQEYLEDLSDQPWVEHVVDSAKGDVAIDNQILGIPIAVEGYGLIYNKAIFEAAGIDPATLTSYEAMDTAFAELQKKIEAGDLKEKFPVLEAVEEFAAKESWIIGLNTFNVPLANDYSSPYEMLKEDTLEIKYADEFKELLDLETKYTAAGENRALLNAVDYATQVGGGIAIERVAVIQQGNWISGEIKGVSEETANNMGILPLPLKGVNEDSIAVGVAINWCVNKNSSDVDKAAAKDFINWLFQSEEGKAIVINEFGFIPPFDNYDGYELTDPLAKEVSRYIQEGNTVAWTQNGFPSGYEAKAAAALQGYLGGELAWEDCIEQLKTDFAELRQ